MVLQREREERFSEGMKKKNVKASGSKDVNGGTTLMVEETEGKGGGGGACVDLSQLILTVCESHSPLRCVYLDYTRRRSRSGSESHG